MNKKTLKYVKQKKMKVYAMTKTLKTNVELMVSKFSFNLVL